MEEITTFKPREYQSKSIASAINVLKHGKKEVIVVPCGGGKTWIINGIYSYFKDKKVLVIVPSSELLEQSLEKADLLNMKYSVYSASANKKETKENLIFATIKSITLEVFKKLNIDYVIIDESDFSTQPKTKFIKLLGDLDIKSCVGLTGTPTYLEQTQDGAVTKIMTNVKKSYFKDVAHVVQIQELVENNYWSDLKYYNVYDNSFEKILKLNTTGSDFTEESQETFFDKSCLLDRVSDFLKRLPQQENALVFVPSIKNALELQEKLPNSIVVSSKTNKKERKELVKGFKDGKYSIAITVLALGVGFDFPQLKNIIDCTPTNSFRVNYQKIGRGVRVDNNKEFCRIIDFAGNYNRFGDIRNITIENIDGYGWCIFNKERLITDVPMKSNKIFTKEYIKNGGKVDIRYVFGQHNKGDAKMSTGKYKGKTIKELYFRKRFYLEWLIKVDYNFSKKDKKFEEQLKMIYS